MAVLVGEYATDLDIRCLIDGDGHHSMGVGDPPLAKAEAEENVAIGAQEADATVSPGVATCSVLQVPSLASLRRSTVSIKMYVAKTKRPITGIAARLQKVVSHYLDKLGSRFGEQVAEVKGIHDRIGRNNDFFIFFCDYVDLCAQLQERLGSNTEQKGASDLMAAIASGDYAKVLADFCRHHRQIGDGSAPSFHMPSPAWIQKQLLPLGFTSLLTDVKASHGDVIYNTHVMVAVSGMLELTCKNFIEVNVVAKNKRDDDDEQSSCIALLRRALRPTAVETISEQLSGEMQKLSFMGSKAEVLGELDKLSHNNNRRELACLTEAIGRPPLTPCGATSLDDEVAEMSWPAAFQVIDLHLCIRDIALVGFALAPLLDAPIGQIPLGDSVGKMTSLYLAMSERVGRLEVLAKELGAATIEQTWQLPTSSATATLWQAAIAGTTGVFQRRLVRVWCHHVNATTARVRAACPSWKACFQGGVCNLDLGANILKGHSPKVKSAHNGLHELLSTVATAAGRIDLAPKLQHHPVSAEVINMATFTLDEARLCSMVIDGVNLLINSEHNDEGPRNAEVFMQAVPKDVLSRFPEQLIVRLQGLARDAAPDEAAMATASASPGGGSVGQARSAMPPGKARPSAAGRKRADSSSMFSTPPAKKSR